ELAARIAPDLREMLFTGHGLALVRPSTVDVFGGAEGDFSVDIPRGSGTSTRRRLGAVAVSSDGHRLLLDRGGVNAVDLVDLGTRSVLPPFSRVPGEPRFGFSADGKWVYVAGLLAGTSLTAWEIRSPIPDRIVEGSPAMTAF